VIWEVEGVSVGHWTDPVGRTGCTVVLLDPAAVASGEVRGGAPATREFALLDPLATVDRIDGIVLGGGSAFGLAAADGVMRFCEERGRGVPTRAGRVPIVVGMSLFDLGVGDPSARPGPDHGHAACRRAGSTGLGAVGAGTGCTIAKWRGPAGVLPGGLVGAVRRDGDLVVAALAAVNAWGDVRGRGQDGAPWPEVETELGRALTAEGGSIENTTIGVVVTNAAVDKVGCHHLARGAHDGLARAVTPPHARSDGDAFVAVATGVVEASVDLVRALGVEVVDEALRSLGPTPP
jgi:L-aminopeptidase/D-esterase-like protein